MMKTRGERDSTPEDNAAASIRAATGSSVSHGTHVQTPHSLFLPSPSPSTTGSYLISSPSFSRLYALLGSRLINSGPRSQEDAARATVIRLELISRSEKNADSPIIAESAR